MSVLSTGRMRVFAQLHGVLLRTIGVHSLHLLRVAKRQFHQHRCRGAYTQTNFAISEGE